MNIKGRFWIKKTVALVFVGAALLLVVGAQTEPTTFLKIKLDPGKVVITDQASFAALRTVQSQMITSIGGNPAVSLKHPADGVACYSCHEGTPKGVQHSFFALNEANPAASCGICHVNDLYERLASLPYFTEVKFALTNDASVADAETRVDNAVACDTTLNLAGVIKNDADAKWEFEVQRLPNEPGALPASFNTLLDKTATALEAVTKNHLTTQAVSPEVQVKVETKAFTVDQLGIYIPELGMLDNSMLAAVSTATVQRSVEGKWKDPTLPYSTSYAFIKDTISAQFGPPKTEKPEQITWDLGGGATADVKFSRVEDNFSTETKVTFGKITVDIEDDALRILKTIATQYANINMAEAKLAHQYNVKNATTEVNALLINALQAYTTTSPLPDNEFKYEVLVKNGTDVLSHVQNFFVQKRADYAGSLVKTKTELRWRPSNPSVSQFKVEVVGANRQ